MPRPKTGDKRAAILRAAIELIADEGIGASTARIARAAGVAEGSLFRYFPDKDTLWNELYVTLKADMRRAAGDGFPTKGSLRSRLLHLWNSYIDWGIGVTSADLRIGFSRIVMQPREDFRAVGIGCLNAENTRYPICPFLRWSKRRIESGNIP